MCTRKTRGPVALVGTALLTLVFSAGFAHEAYAQTGYIPYYGKNKIRYNNFRWHIYTTDHFEVYYYPEIEQHLGRIVSYAESAYQQVSSDLKHDLAFKVPLMLYKTQSEFQQQNVEPSELPEGVLAFAEPYRDRMVLPIDEVDDALYRLITHELTHIFEFDIIPRSLLRRGLPLWVDEGLADYMTAYWNSFDLMTVRDAAIADTVPAMSDFQGAAFVDGRLPYNLGHAAFEFIESRWGKEGLRQFLFALRKNVIGGGESAYEEAFRLKAEEFDEQFDKYLKDRFKPFRDKERPADYGRNLAPKRDKTPFVSVVSIEPSPSGDLLAVAAGNRKEQELDIIILSTKDSKVIQNLTSGFNKDRGYEYIATPGGFRNNAVPWMSWSPAGDQIAYFARTEKMKTLIMQNAVTGRVDQRVEIKTVDMPESPDISPDGKQVAFSGLEGATGDIFIVNLENREVRNITKDNFGDFAPTWSPDGKSIVYLARASGNDKLFTINVATGQKTQLTFGTHDDGGAQFIDDDTLVFPSTAIDPNQPVEPEVARNGNIYNIWTLNLKTKELRQYTDTLTGNTSPVVLRDTKPARIGFVTYYKGEYGIHVLAREEPLHTVASSDFGDAALGPPIPFQPPMTHDIVPANKRKKGAFEKLFLEGRPPVALGVTSGGDIFGGTQVTFTDVLGDKQFNVFAASVSQYPNAVVLVHQPVPPAAVRDTGVLAGAVLLRLRSVCVLRHRLRLHRSRSGHRDADRARGDDLGHLSAQPVYTPRDEHRVPAVRAGIQRAGPPGRRRRVPDGPVRTRAVRRRPVHALRREPRPGNDHLPRVRTARRTHPVARVRVRAELGQPALAPDPRRRCPLLPAARHQRRAGAPCPRLQELGRVPGLPLLRR